MLSSIGVKDNDVTDMLVWVSDSRNSVLDRQADAIWQEHHQKAISESSVAARMGGRKKRKKHTIFKHQLKLEGERLSRQNEMTRLRLVVVVACLENWM